jgi:predicted TIM-barrel fold metal-dependent hydrolase
MLRFLAAVSCVVSVAAFAQGARLPIFDAHLHYNDDARTVYPLVEVQKRFREAGVTTILATSRPNDGTRALLDAATADGARWPRVVPFIRPYRRHADRSTWFNDASIYALIEEELARPVRWRGIGEFHVFGNDADTPWVRRIARLALARGLWLHAHCDEAALVHLLAHAPGVSIIWAHSGFGTPPDRIAELMERHPNLVGELSYRYDVTVDGKLEPAWRALFTRFPDRFVVGSDTWVNERWSRYGEIIDWYRGWLGQLPEDVAAQIAHGNGERLFASPP